MTIVIDFVKHLFRNPGKIYLLGLLIFFLFCFVCIPILSIGHSGGEQVPLILLSYAVDYLVYGLLLISILTSLVYRNWVKKYWYVNVVVFCITAYLIIAVKILNH